MAITNPNSSRQGHDPDHEHHPLHDLITGKHGFAYSHSTPIHQRDGTVLTHHTYAKGEHKVGVMAHSQNWDSKVSSASGHSTSGVGAAKLDQHLTGKRRRYPELREENYPMTPVFDTDEEGRTIMNATVAEALDAAWSNHIVSEIATQGQILEEAMNEQIEEHLVAMASAAEETITEAVSEKIDWLDEKLDEYLNEHLVEEINALREQNELLHAAIRILVENTYQGGDVDKFYAAVRASVASVGGPGSAPGTAYSSAVGDPAARNRGSLRPGQGTSGGTQGTAVNEDGGLRFTREADLLNFADVMAHQGVSVGVAPDEAVLLEGVSPDDRIAKKQVAQALDITRYMAHADRTMPDRG